MFRDVFVPFHKELLKIQDRLFAHSDIACGKQKVANWSRLIRKNLPISFRGYDYSKLDSKVARIEELVKVVAENLQKEIADIEREL